MSQFKCLFQQDWKSKFTWLSEVPSNKNIAFCELCQSNFSLSNMGLRAVTSHKNGKKHQLKEKGASLSGSVGSFFSSSKAPTLSDSTDINATCLKKSQDADTTAPASFLETQQNKQSGSMTNYCLKQNVTEAEILWCLQCIMTHKSLRSAEKDVKFFSRMFPDSDIAKSMKLGRDKMSYVIVHGISRLFEKTLLEEVLAAEYFVLGFDESLNKISQKQQMDLNVRYWKADEVGVRTRYLTSVFLQRSRASDLLTAFLDATKSLDIKKKLLQISMDGPNVNHKFFKDLQDDIRDGNEGPEILNIGSCGLHVINVAFKTGTVATGWKILEFHRALYYLFKDSPARRSKYTLYSNSTLFPKKFCSVRWLENSEVAQRAMDMIPYLKAFIDGVEKNNEVPTCKSYMIVKEMMEDQLLPAKLSFFRTIASEVEGFLREYQSDVPLIPFLYTDLSILMQGLMERFVEDDKLSNSDIMLIDLNDMKNLRPAKRIDVGIGTQCSLRKCKASEKDIALFKNDCRKFLVKCVSKVRERSPLAYSLTRAVSCFDPSVVVNEKVFTKRLTQLLLILSQKNWIGGLAADKAKRQMKDICSRPHVLKCLQQFKRSVDRIDQFWSSVFDAEGGCGDAENVMRMVMIMSHGNANIERGFSINSDCLWENMGESSLVARRRVYDHVISKGGLDSLTISKEMIHYARNARAWFEESKKEKQKEELEKKHALKRKREEESQLKELAAKKATILKQAQIQSTIIDEQMAALRTKK